MIVLPPLVKVTRCIYSEKPVTGISITLFLYREQLCLAFRSTSISTFFFPKLKSDKIYHTLYHTFYSTMSLNRHLRSLYYQEHNMQYNTVQIKANIADRQNIFPFSV